MGLTLWSAELRPEGRALGSVADWSWQNQKLIMLIFTKFKSAHLYCIYFRVLSSHIHWTVCIFSLNWDIYIVLIVPPLKLDFMNHILHLTSSQQHRVVFGLTACLLAVMETDPGIKFCDVFEIPVTRQECSYWAILQKPCLHSLTTTTAWLSPGEVCGNGK